MPTLTEQCKKIKLFLCDVDGVLTDGGMYYSEHGDELKKFCTHDGGGFILLRHMGIKTGLFTSEQTQLVERRGRKLKVDFIIQGAKKKLRIFNNLLEEIALSPEEVAYIGDDINDIEVLQRVGVSATVPDNWLPEKFSCDYVTKCAGGHGAVRDFAEWLLRQRGEYDRALDSYRERISQ
ncbi:HAD-IIIA family hydrolase [candidate division KSB1 bacterium]|nr:HAD-IIIA family hydrolase [candidate division KSB1 bacterium]NIR68802.1 HAD-IIIA family hydrolase [candidate division KSB1 bacterium]NIS28134.1 HAD-IIIA family hydrolase [candidate division KSB1 bacterium]NIT75030.1 HAD-IIIA family hydrolase [candidate division KSB1 bacterium]NIU28814.1 HAD-IIIA family hydrolase [candidate division KSB1 bacterium]